jgi:hypothetical protein
LPEIGLQPKQWDVLELIENGPATMVGMGGGRGAAKSAGIDRIALSLLTDQPGISGCIVMRTYEQVRKYHIDPLQEAFPEIQPYYHKTDKKLKLPCADGRSSTLDIGYAENYDAVERFFRSANYGFIFVDQAEQFTEKELREIKKACRRINGKAVMVLAFNMGGAGIQTLRKWFYTKEYNEREDPTNYAFVKVNPWDNVEWVRNALNEDGLTEVDYYSWTDDKRQLYAATRGEYTKLLNSDDDPIRNRDWLGSWESLEGAYFGRVFDLQSTRINADQVEKLWKSWGKKWMSGDWGKAHYCSHHWHFRVTASPQEVKKILGWEVSRPINFVVTYREQIVNEKTSTEVGRGLVDDTPAEEREDVRRYFLSPDAFGERDSENTIAMKIGDELKRYGLPRPEQADNDRQGGWMLMAEMLREAKEHASGAEDKDVWLISSECPQLLNALPLLMRDPKNLDDVLKTDKGDAKIEQDVADDVRYGLKSMLSPGKKPQQEVIRETLDAIPDMTQRHMKHMQMMDEKKKHGGAKPLFVLRRR